MNARSVVLTEEDAATVSAVLETLGKSCFPDTSQIASLKQLLDTAGPSVCQRVPDHVVRIGSSLRVCDVRTGKKKTYELVCPALADVSRGLLAFSTPLGIALIGRREGEIVQAITPGGNRILKIERVKPPQPGIVRHITPPQSHNARLTFTTDDEPIYI